MRSGGYFATQNNLFINLNAASTWEEAGNAFEQTQDPQDLISSSMLFLLSLREAEIMHQNLAPFSDILGSIGIAQRGKTLGALVRGLDPETLSKIKKTAVWQAGVQRFRTEVAQAAKAYNATTEEDESWIHERSLILKFRHLVANAEAVARLEKHWGFQLDLSFEAIERKAKELDKIFTAVTLPIPEAFFDLTQTQQEILLIITQAMKLMEVPHRLQASAHADVIEQLVMETPALEPLRKFYIRFAGVFNFSEPDAKNFIHSFLPGMEEVTRFPGGGYYPEGMTLPEFRLFVEQKSEVDLDMRVVFRFDEDGELEAIPYSQFFRQWFDPAAKLLRGAFDLLDWVVAWPDVSRYLKRVVNAFEHSEDGAFRRVDEAWLQIRNPDIDMMIGPMEQYLDGYRKWLAEIRANVQIKDLKREEELAPLRDLFPAYEDNLPGGDAYKKEDRSPPYVTVADTLVGYGDASSGKMFAVAYNCPNDPQIRDKPDGARVVVMANHLRVRDVNAPVTKALEELLFDDDQRYLITPERRARGIERAIFLHELAHGNGHEHVVGDESVSAMNLYDDLYYTLEEPRADVIGLHDGLVAFREGVLTREELDEIYGAVIFDWINKVWQRGIEEDHSRGHIAEINFLINEGAITMNHETGRIRLHLDKWDAAVHKLGETFQRLKGDGNKEAVARFFSPEAVSIPKGLAVLMKKLQGYPKELLPSYEFDRVVNRANEVGAATALQELLQSRQPS